MTIFTGDTLALDFELVDIGGENIRLSDFRGRKHVVLLFLRGFL